MSERFQFNVRNLLLATALIALACGMLAGHEAVFDWATTVELVDSDGDGNLEVVDPPGFYEIVTACYFAAMMALPSLTVGVLAGRPGLGALCGAATAAFVLVLHTLMYFGMWE